MPVMFITEETIVAQSKTVARYQLSVTRHAPKAFQVKYPVLCSHHVIIFAELVATFITFSAKKTDVVFFAVGLAVAHEAGTVLVQKHLTFVALKIGK